MSEEFKDFDLQVEEAMAALAALRAGGGTPFEPVQLHYLEALARRSQGYDGDVKRHLEDKLRQALAQDALEMGGVVGFEHGSFSR